MVLLVFFFVSSVFATQQAFIDYSQTNVLRSTLSLQVVANPLLELDSCPEKAKAAFALLQKLCDAGADWIRYVPWYPFPWFGVGALEGPGKWNFSFVAPQLFAFLNATNGRRRLINFSTQPAWAYTGKKNSYPSDPLAVDWNYSNGLAPNANTTNLLADYYGRLVSWIVKGSFVDESGRVVGGGPAVGPGLQGYELFNEVDASCHDLTPESYSQQFDAITSQILKVVNPNPIKLVGLALASRNISWVKTFLESGKRDAFSFHFYSGCTSRSNPVKFESMIQPQVDEFLPHAQAIVDLRNSISPDTEIFVDELGTILPHDNDVNVTNPPKIYFKASGAQFAYSFIHLAKMGVDVIGMSQLVGSPTIAESNCRVPDPQYPSVSMFDPDTNSGNARADVLLTLLSSFKAGSTLLANSTSDKGPVSVQGIVVGGLKKALLINTSSKTFVGINIKTNTGFQKVFVLDPFDVVVVDCE